MRKSLPAAAVVLALAFPSGAEASCACVCINGAIQPVCSSAIEIRPICPPTICPIVPPSVRPIPTPMVPPIGTRHCAPQQVWNGYRYEWRTICR